MLSPLQRKLITALVVTIAGLVLVDLWYDIYKQFMKKVFGVKYEHFTFKLATAIVLTILVYFAASHANIRLKHFGLKCDA